MLRMRWAACLGLGGRSWRYCGRMVLSILGIYEEKAVVGPRLVVCGLVNRDGAVMVVYSIVSFSSLSRYDIAAKYDSVHGDTVDAGYISVFEFVPC
jgi:hypothetical protein